MIVRFLYAAVSTLPIQPYATVMATALLQTPVSAIRIGLAMKIVRTLTNVLLKPTTAGQTPPVPTLPAVSPVHVKTVGRATV
jgi:hypothetical protein